MTKFPNNTTKVASIMKSFIALLLALIITTAFTTTSSAQGWKNTYPIGISDQGQTVAECLDGGYIIAGRNSTNLIIARTDIDGELLWSNVLPANYVEASNKIVPTIDGGYLLAGRLNGQASLIKINAFGAFEWEQLYSDGNSGAFNSLKPTLDGNYIGVGYQLGPVEEGTLVVKIDENGVALWEYIYPNYLSTCRGYEIIANVDSTYTFLAVADNNGFSVIANVDADGENLLSSQSHPLLLYFMTAAPDGDFLIAGDGFAMRTDAAGGPIWAKGLTQIGYYCDLATATDGFLIASHANDVAIAVKMDFQGNILWEKEFPSQNSESYFTAVVALENDDAVFGGTDKKAGAGMFMAKLDGDGNLFSNNLKGTIFYDLDENCSLDPADTPLGNWLVAVNGVDDFYGFTDQAGNYDIDLPAGNYVVSTAAPGQLWESCPQSDTVTMTQNDLITSDFALKTIVDCPYLQVDISTPLLRRCFDNTYTVQYKNTGTITAANAYVEVTFDSLISLNSSSIPLSSQVGNTYVFLLGDLVVNETGQFTINVTLSCDAVLGQTHCIEAHVYPDDQCLPPLASWDGSITNVRGECFPDSLLFTIENLGASDMSSPLKYFVVEDNLIMKTGTFQLNSGMQLEIKMPANGSTYRLYAEQALGYFPDGYQPTVAIEGCGIDPTTNEFSIGFITSFSEDDQNPYLSIDCQENIGSFDPNDKRAEPAGFGEEHFITRTDELDYHIRFQNVGTDTAFTVVVRDTLSPHLDVSSMTQGAASHAYDLDIINGDILKYTFNDILLVDSTTNEAASHGFIKFKIAQKENLPLGTIINNSAAVYFDFNEPVITNETYHEIGENYVEVIQYVNDTDFPLLEISVAPNPFSKYTNFTVEGVFGEKQFQLYDAMGRKLAADSFTGTDYRFYNEGLSAGVYFYSILGEDGLLGSGKLVVE